MDHPVERKLRSLFCPYLVTARHLRRWRPYLVYTVYSYLGELFVLLAGFGLSNPVLAFLSGGQARPENKDAPTVVAFLSSAKLGWLALLLLVVWGLVKLYVRREDLEKRCSLADSYRRQCLQIEKALRDALFEPNPMPLLTNLQLRLSDLVDRSIAKGVVPGQGVDENLEKEANDLCDRLVATFSRNWVELPPNERSR